MDAIEPAPRSRSGRTNCQKDQQPSRPRAAKNQASWYCSSWRGLQSDASTPDDSRLITPETTPPSIPTNSATAPASGSSVPDQSMGDPSTNNEAQFRCEARSDRERRRSSAPDDLREPRH